MKRYRLILFMIICSLLTACGQTTSVSEAIVSSTSETMISESVTETEPERAEEILEEVSAGDVYDETIQRPEMKEAYSNWREAYLDYIEYQAWETAKWVADWWKRPLTKEDIEWEINHNSYYLIYVDNDDIPELFISSNSFAGGCDVATYYNKSCINWHLRNESAKYIPNSGYLYTDAKGAVYITRLVNGKFDIVMTGEYHIYYPGENWDIEECEYWIGKDSDDVTQDDFKMDYENTVTEQEYKAAIAKYMDIDKAVWVGDEDIEYQYEEIVSILKTGHTRSDNHRYELIRTDITWDQAFEAAQKADGYLAVVTGEDEYETIREQIEDENLKDSLFYVSYINGKNGEENKWIYSDKTEETADFILHQNCQYGDSEYSVDNGELNFRDDDVGIIKYSSSDSDIYLYLVPKDLLAYAEKYKGRIGYIIEYDE
ncbi:hypothetical protein SAMN02910339_00014 [Lachnospiraceae bacterium YSD2013]|nr:hypothetical protein SAMN02910339_00014 [Lachnospiraceae bacterium YSD2013]